MGIAHGDLPAAARGPHAVGDDPVVGKIAAADHISRAGGGDGAAFVLEKGLLVAVGHQLGAGLAVGVGVVAIQGIRLPVAVLPLPVFINLIRGHVQKREDAAAPADALQHMDRSHHIGFIGVHRVLVGIPYNGLGRQVEHNLRPGLLEGLLQMFQIPHIPDHAGKPGADAGDFKQAGIRRRIQTVPGHLRTCQGQDTAQPGTFKSRMTGDQHPFSFIKFF